MPRSHWSLLRSGSPRHRLSGLCRCPFSVRFATCAPRFTMRDRTLSVAITGASLTVETTRYRQYLDFRSVVARVFDAAAELLNPDGIARVGMRYIDEIRVPGIEAERPSAWRDWIDPSLLPPQLDAMVSEDYEPAAWDGAVRYVTGPEKEPGPPLRRRAGLRC